MQNWEKKSQYKTDKEKLERKENFLITFMIVIGILSITSYIYTQVQIAEILEVDHLIDGKVLPRNDAQMFNGYNQK